MLHLINKEIYQLKLQKQWRLHDVFHRSLLEQDTIKKEWVDQKVTELELETCNNKKYKIEAIWDSAIYANETKSYLPSLYYLIA